MRTTKSLVLGLTVGLALAASATRPALAAPPCGAVEFQFQPGAYNLQMVVWVEDNSGAVIATPYITRATGQFGIGNRPGAALLKTDCGWPYGRREMVMPVWAHRRDHHYPKVMMGGACGNSPASECPGGGSTCGGNCDDTTIAYHGLVSSSEPYFCAPEGCVPGIGPDVVSCASPIRTLSKGAYLDKTMKSGFSLYPPRADVIHVDPAIDSPDVSDYVGRNDVAAVSQATPRPGQALPSPIYWNPSNLPPGDYVAWIEVSQESDFNSAHNHPNQDDAIQVWNQQGHPFLGQPSVLYKVPFHYDGTGSTQGTATYAGYGSWDGSDGMLRAPDGTITTGKDGTGEGRLVLMPDHNNQRFQVVVGTCATSTVDGGTDDGGLPHGDCLAPAGPTALTVTPAASGTELDVSFQVPSTGILPGLFNVRYTPGTTPISDGNFLQALAGGMPAATLPGDTITVKLMGLQPDTDYQVAVRGQAACGTSSSVVAVASHTKQMTFTTLHGCFVATAAYGSPLEHEVDKLRAFRDHRLLPSAAGQLFVASYYAFGPSLAAVIAHDGRLRAQARRVLGPIVELVTALR